MTTKSFTLTRYDADEGKVFDWKNLKYHQYEDMDGNTVQEHLYAKTIFVGGNDSIDNYEEVDAPTTEATEETETTVEE